jgi:hypothetical protein
MTTFPTFSGPRFAVGARVAVGVGTEACTAGGRAAQATPTTCAATQLPGGAR